MIIEKISTYPEFMKLRSTWNELLKRSATNTVFLTHEWISSWLHAYGGKRELCVLLLKDGDALRAIAPLLLTDLKIFRRLGFIGAPRADYADFIVQTNHPSDYHVILDFLLSHYTSWDEILFENVPQTSPLHAALDQFSSRLIIKKQELDICPFLKINEKSDELLKNLSKKQSLKRKINKLLKVGELRFRHYVNLEDMEKALQDLITKYLWRFDKTHAKRKFSSELVFYKELIRQMLSNDMVRFSALDLDGKPIAQHFGFSYNKVYYWVKPTFDDSYAEYSPGLVMLYYLIDYAVKNHYEEFDFLRGTEPFKLRFSNHYRQVTMVRIYRNFSKYLYCTCATKAKRIFEKCLNRYPFWQ